MPRHPRGVRAIEADEEDVTIDIVPVGSAGRDPEPPSMDEAFETLCLALHEKLQEDLPAQMHVEEIMAWYSNGLANGPNAPVCWQHAVALLEQVLGVRMSA